MSNAKIRVAVVYGGKSGEHEVSLTSAASVIKALDQNLFEIVPIGIDKQGRWHLNKLPEVLANSQLKLSVHLPSSQEMMLPSTQQDLLGGQIDVVFPVVHGPLCEDGSLQGLLELAGLPYVGSGVLASAIGMDKDIAKRLAKAAGIAIPAYLTLHDSATPAQRLEFCHQVATQIKFPAFVKPARLGSSVGMEKVNDVTSLQSALEKAFKYDSKIVVEQFIDAQEIELSVLENINYGEDPLVSIAGEIRVGGGHAFYSYEAKYLDPNGAELLIPAAIDSETMHKTQQLAQRIFKICECEGMARVDLFLDKTDGTLYFNELNTLPGFTPISMYPKMWQASGVPYPELLTMLIELAIARHKRRQRLVTEYK